ncbi:uncharacterized protein C8R40DRAFT_1071213 [Lentinula edodes]|uniref:uncharacterized protein n=1 Tax=Lentinula edodes TaxID=5353 RepID=UPI001E8EB8E0|nr:uncharacterized protein C8R40DRAFT_1071213 [Lentinula edodes]KAH7873261.1 hypothetical protein C8R40DRAFT_1071213 [Lentinula edodes]
MAPPRPPFGTDEPESIYETPNHPQRRIRQPAPVDPNSRTSAYNVYNNYIHDDSNRQSGIDALGAGFMNGSMDDDDDEPQEKYNPFTSAKEQEASKHAMLAAAIGPRKTPTPPPQYIASPRPGYAASVEALSRPEPAAIPATRQPPNGLSISTSNNPFATPMDHQAFPNGPHVPQPIAVPNTPHPLQPPMTPITPVFARPTKQQDIRFDEKPIMRGAGEGTSIPSRGEKGDDFWRRFSMVVKEENSKPSQQKQSSWLKTTQGRTNSMFRWVFFIGMILTICALGAIGLWWYASHNSTAHDQPHAMGGSESEAGSASTSAVGHASSAGVLQTSLHVSPTNTVARRIVHELYETQPTGLSLLNKRHKQKLHLNRVD